MLGFSELLDTAEFRDGGGILKKIWTGLTRDHVEHQKVIVLHDPEEIGEVVNLGARQMRNGPCPRPG